MAVDPVTTETTYVLTGSLAGPFNTIWPCSAVTEVSVTLYVGANSLLLQPGPDYTITGADPLTHGCQVTLTPATVGAGWPANAFLALRRLTATGQPSTFGEATGFSPSAAEAAIDGIARQVQEVDTRIARTFRAQPGEQLRTLPNKVSRALGVPLFDVDGDLTVIPLASVGRGAKGDPGGNIMSVGAFNDIPGMNIPLGTTRIRTSGWATGSLLGAAEYFEVGVPGGGATRYLIQSANARWWQLDETSPTPEQYGCKADGSDDTVAFGVFLDRVNGKNARLPGQYHLTSLLQKGLSNCSLVGIPGQTKIYGSFDYAVLQLLALSQVSFYGITFETTYANVVEDSGKSVVFSHLQDVRDVEFRRCTFRSPLANTSGLTFYARIGLTDTAVIDGLWIQDCEFLQVGRIGCTIMNRSADVSAARRVFFNRNKGKDLGLSGTVGMLLSLDGYGEAFEVISNVLENCLVIGIENTGWSRGRIANNMGRDFSRVWRLLSLDGSNGGSPRFMSGLIVEGNTTEGSASGHSNILYVTDSHFRGNVFDVSEAAGQAVLVRGCSRNRFQGEEYINRSATGHYALYCEQDTAHNEFDRCLFDNSASATAFSTARFSGTGSSGGGAGTNANRISGARIAKGTGGPVADQVAGAIGNLLTADWVNVSDLRPQQQYGVYAMPDADGDIQPPFDMLEFEIIQVNGANTVGRTLNWPSAAATPHKFTLRNRTGQNLTLSVAGAVGGVAANGTDLTAFFDGMTLLVF